MFTNSDQLTSSKTLKTRINPEKTTNLTVSEDKTEKRI